MPEPQRAHLPATTRPASEPETPAEDPLLDRMVRRPTEEDFADVLTPEGNSGDIVPRDVTDDVLLFPSNGSLGGTISTGA